MTRTILVDDHQLVREGFSALLEENPNVELVGTAENGKEGLRLLSLFEVDLVISDIDMPEMDGIEFLQAVKAEYSETKVIMLSMHEEPSMIKQLIQMGADGYLLKTSDKDELFTAVDMASKGRPFFNETVMTAMQSSETEDSAKASELSTREIEVLKLIAEGKSSKEVGEELHISPRTVDTHRNNLMQKLDIHNIAGLVRYAFKAGLAD